MDVRQFTFLARQASAAVQPRESFWGLPKRGLAFILANAMFWQPLLVQADGIVVNGSATSVGQAANGVPIVNIATPNGGGLSHNKFSDYNVGQQGVILNNATNRTESTQLGGIILGNSNLNGRAASIILNEVNGGSPSQLKGYTEVAGKSAHVIVANPYGISCNGCGFINTPKATLTTGKPVIENGQLQRYQVEQGSVAIEGAGLNASNIDQFEIITRSAKINAEIQAKHLAVIAGANDVDAKTLNATARSANPADAPQLAIDSSALGGMYAGAIKLVGTEAGVGVKLDGKLIASGGDIQLDASGQLRMAVVSASGAVAINAASLEAQGAVYAGRDLKVETQGALNNHNSLAARDSITLSSGGQLHNNGIIEAGINADSSRNQSGDVRLTAQNLNNSSKSVVASRDLTVTTTQTLNNQGGTLSGQRQVGLSAATLDNQNQGRVLSTGATDLKAKQLFNGQGGLINSASLSAQVGQLNNNGGRLTSVDGLTLDMTQGHLNNQDGLINAAQLTLKNLNSVDNRRGEISSAQAFALMAQNLDNSHGKLLGNQALTLRLDQALSNVSGLISSNGLEATAATLDNRSGIVTSRGDLALSLAGALNNHAGEVSSLGSTTLKGVSLDNSDGQVSGDLALSIDLSAGLNNQKGVLGSGKNLDLKTASLDNSQAGSLISDDRLSARINDLLDNQQGDISAKGLIDVQAGRLDNRNGSLTGKDLLTLRADALDNRGGLLSALGLVHLDAASLDNSGGRISSKSGLSAQVKQLVNQRGALLTEGELSLKGSHLDNRDSGLVGATKALKLDVGEIDNRGGEVSSSQGVVLQGARLDNSDSGKVLAGTDLGLSVAQIINQNQGLLFGKGALALSGQSLDNSRGSLVAMHGLDIRLDQALSNLQGLMSSEGTLSAQVGSLDNGDGKVSSAAALTLTSAGALLNRHGSITTDAALNISSQRLDNRDQGLISSKGAAQVSTGTFDNTEGARLISGDRLELNAAQVRNGEGSRIAGEKNLTASVSGFDQQGGELFSKTALSLDLNQGQLNNHKGLINAPVLVLKNLADVNNQGGEISSAQAFTLAARNLDNSSGKLISQHGLSLGIDRALNNLKGLISARTLDLRSNHLDNTEGLLSSRGAQVLKVDGTLNNQGGRLIASQGLELGAGSLDNRQGGLVNASLGLQLKVDAIDNRGGELSSQTEVNLSGSSLDNSDGGKVLAEGALGLVVAQVINRSKGLLSGKAGLTLSGNSLDNSGGSLLSLQDLKAELQGNLDNRQGLLSAEGRLGLKSAELNNNAGSLSSAGALTLEHSGALLNQGGAILTDGALVLNSARLDNRNQGNISAKAAASINTGALDNSHSGSLSSGDSLNLSTGQLTNQDQGRIASGAALTASVSGLDQQGGQLFSNTALTLDLNQGQLNNQQGLINAPLLMLKNLKDVNNQGGEISAAQAFTLAADSLDNSLGKLISNDRLSLKAQSLLNQGGLVSGWQGLSANLRSLDNRNQGTLSSRSGGLDLQVSGDLQNSNAGALVSQKALNVVAANLDNSSGGIVSSAGEQNLNLSGVLNNTQGGQIDSGAALTLNLLGILSNNNGQLASAGPLRIERASQIDNQGGQIASQGLLTLFSGALDNRNRGTLAANEQLTLAVDGELQNSGDGLIYSQNSGLHVQAGSLVNGKGTLQSQGAMSLTTRGDIDNQSGRMLAKNGDLTIGANNLDNRGGVLASVQGAMTANLSGVLKNGYDLNNNRLGGVAQAQRLTLKALAGIDNDGGRISAQSGNALITTRDFDNRNGGLYANSLIYVSGGNLDNSGEQSGRIAGQQVDLDLSGALNNRLGIIESASTLAIKAASLDNQAGQLRALGASGTTRFEIGGQFDNRNGTLESANSNLSLGVGSFLNDSGNLLHVGSGTFDIATANVSGAGGSIVTRGGLTLNADSWHNNSVIQAGRLTVNVNTFSQTASGQLLASETLTGSGGNWSNDGLIASDGSLSLTLGGTYLGNGRLSSRGTLGLDAAQLNLNAAASIAGGADTTLAIGGQLTNAGRLTSGAKLNLSAGAVSNQGTLGAAQDLTLTTGALLNDHALVFSGGDMNLLVDSLTNSYADIYSLGNLTIDRDGQGTLASSIINSSGSLQSDGSMSLAASTLQNVRAVLTTDNRGIYSARIGEIACIEGVNAGDCSGKRNHVWEIVQRDKFEVTDASAASSITSGGNLLINGGDLLNRSSTIAAAGNLVATLNNLTNSGVETGETETTRVFRSARTRNASSWSNAANAFTNRYWFQSGGYNPNNLGGLEGAMASFIGRTEREYTNLGSTRKLAGSDQSYAAVIQAGGAVNVRAGNGIDSAVVRPGYTYVGSGARTNTDAPGTAFATRVTLNPQLPPDLAQQQVNPLALPGFNLPTGQSGLFRLSGQDGSTPLASGSQTWAMGGAGLSTAAHQQTLPVASVQSINDVDAAQFVAGSAELNTANRTAATVSAEASEINAALPGAALAPSPLLHAPSVTGDGISQASVLNGQLVPPSLLSIDRVQGLPDSSVRSNPHKYLIETNPALTNLKQFMSSDYLLSKLGYNPDDSWKRLGDGFYEQKLIQQAVVARTGQRFLAGQNTDEQLFKYLMDNAIQSKQSLNLAVGVSLSSEQVAALTHDIVWLENAEVNGEQVLVPVLYLAQANNRLAPNGALIAGSDVNLIAGQDLNNVGTLRATHNLLAQAGQNLVNSGLMEAGNRLDLLAGNNLVNKAGGILAGHDVSLTATQGDVINERTLTSHQSSNGSYTQQRDFVDNAARVEAVNDLVINAGRDLNNNGGALKSGADTTIKAGRDVNLTSVEQVVSNDRGARHNNLSITQNGSSLEAGRDLSINAGRDISAIASQIEAKRDIAMAAGDNLILSSATDEQHSYSKSKKVTRQEDHVSQVATTISAGGDVNLSAGKDLALIASRVSAGDEAYLVAGDTLALMAAQDSDYSLYDMKKKGSWGSKKTKRDEVTDVKNIGSEIKTGGDLTLKSGGDQTYQVAKLDSGQDILLDSGGAITFEGVKDLHQESHEKTNNNAFWVSSKGKGNTDETLRQSQMVAAGNIVIKAVDGLQIDVRQVNQQSVSQTINAMVAADPQLAWLKDAEQRGDVDWRQVKEIHDSFKYSNAGLGPASQIIIAIVMAAVVGPMAGGLAGGGTTGAVVGAVATGASTNATVSFINNGGNLGAVFKDVTSSSAMKGYLISGVTAGLTADYFSKWTDTSFDPVTKKITVDLSTWKGIGQFAANQGLQNGTSFALSKIMGQGGDLGDALQSTLFNTLAAASFNAVGGYTKGVLDDGSLGKIAIHAMVGGLLAQVSGGDFRTGALAAGANEAMVDQLNTWVSGDQNLLNMSSQLVGMLAAATQSDADAASLQKGAWVAQNATQYNYLNHDQLAEAAKELRACANAACREELVARYKDLSFAQDLEAAAACSASPASCAAYSKEVANTMANLDDIYQTLGDGPTQEWEILRQSNLGFQEMLATFTAGHTSASIAEAMQQKWGLSDEETKVVAENLVLVAAGGVAAIAAKKALSALKAKSDEAAKATPSGLVSGETGVVGTGKAAANDASFYGAKATNQTEPEVIAKVNDGRAPYSELNGAIGEARGWNQALGSGQVPISGPGKASLQGADYITYDPATRSVIVWDAKYRAPGGSYPSSLPPSKLKAWQTEIINSVKNMPDGQAKVSAENALKAGRVEGRIFKWPQ